MIASGLVILAVSFVILPGINGFINQNVHVTASGSVTTAIINNSTTITMVGPNHWWNGTVSSYPFQSGPIPAFVSKITGVVGTVGLVSGLVVLMSGIMMRRSPDQRTLWGALIVVFSVMSFFGAGGFIVGAILGIIGGIMALTWRPSTQPAG